MTCFEPYRHSLDALIEAFDVCLRSVSTPAASQSDNQAVARFCLLVLEYTKWRVATAVGSSTAITSTSTSSADDSGGVVAVEGLVFSALKSVGRALASKEVVACVSDATATALVIALSDLLDAKLDCHSVPVEMCPMFKSAFEKGEETPLMFACVKINSLFTSRQKLGANMKGGSRCVVETVVGLAKLPAFLSYVSIPPQVWQASSGLTDDMLQVCSAHYLS